MEQEILNYLKGNKVKYNKIILRSRDSAVLNIRWKVFVHLRKLGYTQHQIAMHFNFTDAAVAHGLKKAIGISGKDSLQSITDTLVSETTKSIGGDKKALYFALHKAGCSKLDIASYFNVSVNEVRRNIQRCAEIKDFENRRKNIVKF